MGFSDDTIEHLFHHAEHAAGVIIGNGEQHPPTFILLDRSGQATVIVQFNITCDADKDNIPPQLAQTYLQHPGVGGYVYVSEAWLVRRRPGDVVGARLESVPDRIEVVTAEVWTPDGAGRGRTWRIVRGDGPPRLERLGIDRDAAHMGGRMTNFYRFLAPRPEG